MPRRAAGGPPGATPERRLASDNCEAHLGDMSLAASGKLSASDARALPVLTAHLAVKEADAALLTQLLEAGAIATPGAPRLRAGRIISADLAWRGPVAAGARPW